MEAKFDMLSVTHDEGTIGQETEQEHYQQPKGLVKELRKKKLSKSGD